jgi:hypothetical protein
MFEDIVIVQSAVSAFNNAALAAPAFMWVALLALPLFGLVYFCGDAFLKRFGWTKENFVSRSGVAVAVLTLLWVVLFGGNYAVLRDGVSVLPFMTAVIVFLTSLFIGSHLREFALPQFKGLARRKKLAYIFVVILWLAMLGGSDLHAWWGPLLQIGAFVLGMMMGRAGRAAMRPIAGTVLIMMMVAVAMLMQPEFFRFGQLGDLTPLHLLALMVLGILAMAVVALYNVNPRNKIHRSAFVKLKWMVRFVVALAMVLFVMTESVPVFLGGLGATLVLFAMSVWHAESVPEELALQLFSGMLVVFGIITVMPAITALGILGWAQYPTKGIWGRSKFLL